MKKIMLFESFSKWYRGYTTKTEDKNYLWLTKDKDMAEVYSIINNAIYGGDKIISKYKVDLKNKNILDLSEYDMDNYLTENKLEEILNEINVEFDDILDLFDIMEDEIPLSRLINQILDIIMDKYDALKIKESNKLTLCIKKDLITFINKKSI